MKETFATARRAARERDDFSPFVDLIPAARFMGLRMERIAGGAVRSVLPYRDSFIGNVMLPALHGGVTAAFMEHAALLHLLATLEQERIPKSIDFAIDYLLPGRAQDSYCDCEVSRAGVRVAQVQVRCWQRAPDKPIAIARGHFLLAAP